MICFSYSFYTKSSLLNGTKAEQNPEVMEIFKVFKINILLNDDMICFSYSFYTKSSLLNGTKAEQNPGVMELFKDF